MKILMLGWELPPHNSGGLGVACLHLSKALANLGVEIDFVLPYRARHEDLTHMNIVSALDIEPGAHIGIGGYDSAEYGLDVEMLPTNVEKPSIYTVQRQYRKFIKQSIHQFQPDVIHAHDWLTMQAGVDAKMATGAPLIIHVHATEYERAGGKDGNPLVHAIEQEALMMADRILAVSDITRQIIVNKYGIPADKIDVVHNALDPESMGEYSYDVSTYYYLESLKSEGYTIVSTVGRLTIMKGLKQFLTAAARASEKYDRFAFLIAGDGEQRDELIEMSADLGISDKVFFTGFVRGKQWRDAYSVSDVFVMNSSSEPFGLTALEAAHHDNALLISKQSGVGEILSSVLRFDFWDTEKLADQLVGLATSQVLINSLKSNVHNEYARLSWKDVALRCINSYKLTEVAA